MQNLIRSGFLAAWIIAAGSWGAPALAEDCDGDGIDDAQAIKLGLVPDCNGNGVPDFCDVYLNFTSYDFDDNGVPDECDIAEGLLEDCNGNGLWDYVDVFGSFDFLGNFVGATSEDCNNNVVPDECEDDCNGNGVPDVCDIRLGTSQDCNGNLVPDECDFAAGTAQDCNSNGIPDECDVARGLSLTNTAVEFGIDHTGFALNPIDIQIGDMNGDGLDDIVTANRSFPLGRSVGVFLNLGGGAFAPGAVYNAGIDAEGVALGDFDGDGDLDVAVTVRRAAGFGVDLLRNDGNGVLSPWQSLGGIQVGIGIAAGDLDGDGDVDFAVADINGHVLAVYFNVGGIFGAPVNYATGNRPIRLVIADLDNDGDRDIAVSVQNTSSVAVFANNGAGVFGPRVDYPVPPGDGGGDVAAADLNGDGWPDLAVAIQSRKQVGVLLNNGGGLFGPTAVYPGPGDNTVALTTGDFDSDGTIDVAITTSSGILPGALAVLRNRGDGSLLGPQSWIIGDSPLSVAAGDFDGDGQTDLATGIYQNEIIRVHLNRSTAPVESDCNGNGIPDSCEPARCIGDLTGDGQRDQADLAQLLASYLTDAGGDLDCDGDTDQADLAQLLAVYNQPCP